MFLFLFLPCALGIYQVLCAVTIDGTEVSFFSVVTGEMTEGSQQFPLPSSPPHPAVQQSSIAFVGVPVDYKVD